jgi:hypothetical protein
MTADFSELMTLAADLEQGGEAISGNVRKAVQVTSHKIKEDAKASVRGRKGLGHAANAITYDTTESRDGVEAEIGYDKGRGAGKLGNLIEFGAPNSGNQLSPSHDLGNALLKNEDDFVHGLEKAVDDALNASNL